MNKFFIFIFIIFTILFQFIHEVNTQLSNDPSISRKVSIPGNILPPSLTLTLATPAPALPVPTIPTSFAVPTIPTSFAVPAIPASFTVPTIGIVPVTARPRPVSRDSDNQDIYSPRFLGLLTASVIGGISVVMSLLSLCYFLVRKYRNNKANAIPGLNNNDGITNNEIYDGKLLPTNIVISNQGQEFTPNLPNNKSQRVSACDNSTNNEVIET